MPCGEPVDIENPCRTTDGSAMLGRHRSRGSNRPPESLLSICFSSNTTAGQFTAHGQETDEEIRKSRARRGGNKSVRPAAAPDEDLLPAEGIRAEVFESSPGRGSLHARLPGSGGAPPVILLAHLDVVPADPRGWRFPPFSGALEHGYVYGRGALDAKGVAVVELMALVALKRIGQPIDRDVILLATADEETGGRAGAGWIVQHRPELLGSAEYLLTEGDHIHVAQGGRKVVQVAVAEKTPCWVKL